MRISPKEMLIMILFLTMIRYKPKSLCKVVVFLTTVSLALLFAINAYLFMPIASFNFYITSNNVTQLQTNDVAYHVKKQANSTACSEGMFLSPNGCLSCPNGTFSFPGWSECKPFLNCSEIATQVHNTRRIPGGFTKRISLAEWKAVRLCTLNVFGRVWQNAVYGEWPCWKSFKVPLSLVSLESVVKTLRRVTLFFI